MFWKVEVLERRLVLSVFYDYDVLAKAGDLTTQGDTIASFAGETSINDSGRAAFVANVTGPNGNGTAVIAADKSSISKISFANPASGRRYDFAQITNDNLVISKDLISSTDLLRTWNALSPGAFNVLVKDGDPGPGTPPPTPPAYEIVQLGSRANDGGIAYVGNVAGGPTSVFVKTATAHQAIQSINGGGFRPMIGDGGAVTWRQGVAGTQEIYIARPSGGKKLAGSDFTALGQPGISDDGQVVAFAGNSVAQGKGIFLSYFDGANYTSPIKVAGLPNELGFDNAGNAIQLNDFDFAPAGTLPPALPTLSNRVGVVHRSAGAAGIADDTILLSFIATPSAASYTNNHTAKPLMFSASKGLWTLKLLPQSPLVKKGAAAGAVVFDRRTSPMPVVQVGDTIAGRVVTDFSIFDPIATATSDQSGAARATIDNGDNYVVFRASTAAGDMVVRAAQLDSDSDGLYDHWEKAGGGIDVDLDGTIDLDLNAMGARTMHKDLFLEMDWLAPDFAAGHNYAPQASAIALFKNQFANSPLTNPDGATGVTVHVDAGAGLSVNMGAGSLQGGDNITHSGDGKHINLIYFGKTDPMTAFPGNFDEIGRPIVTRSMEDIKKNFFSTTDKGAREMAFKYTVLGDHYDVQLDMAGNYVGLNGSSGLAEAASFSKTKVLPYEPGNDFLVTLLGARGPASGLLTVPTPVMGAPATVPSPSGYFQAQTLAHELGHTLGLLHGGYDFKTSPPPNYGAAYSAAMYRPTYRSLMNYAYQLDPDTSGNLVQDYSGSGDTDFDDWASVTFAFNQYFDTLGGTPSYFAHGDEVTDVNELDEPPDYLQQVALINGPPDSTPPTISIDSPANNANLSTGGNLTVNLTASDDGSIASVMVSFDINGDGIISANETIAAAHQAGNSYQAVFNSISGAAGSRTLTATATDAVAFTTDDTRTINVTTGGGGTPPKVIASSFKYAALPHQLTFKFDQNVGASLAPQDFFVRKTDGTGALTPSSVVFDDQTNTATVTLPGKVPDGRYIVTLSSAGISSAGGNLDGDGNGASGPDFDFHFLFTTGDADNDGQIGFSDLVIVAQNYGKSPTTALTGDLNYDGETGFADLVLVAQRYGTGLPDAGLPVAAPAIAAPVIVTPKKITVSSAMAKPAPAASGKAATGLPPFYAPPKRRRESNWLFSS